MPPSVFLSWSNPVQASLRPRKLDSLTLLSRGLLIEPNVRLQQGVIVIQSALGAAVSLCDLDLEHLLKEGQFQDLILDLAVLECSSRGTSRRRNGRVEGGLGIFGRFTLGLQVISRLLGHR